MPWAATYLSIIPQPWRDEELELGQFRDPLAAATEAAIEDVSGGRGETRLQAVKRVLVEQFKAAVE